MKTAEEFEAIYNEWFENYYDKRTSGELIRDIVAAQFQQEWVDVKDRLPEVNQMVLVYVPDIGKVAITPYNHFEEWNNSGFVYRGVTHWQPLPAPPKEK